MAAAEEGGRKFARFAQFYPCYLGEHKNRTSRRLRFVGTSLSLLCPARVSTLIWDFPRGYR